MELTADCWPCDEETPVYRRADEEIAVRELCTRPGGRGRGLAKGDERCGISELDWVGGARGCGLSR